MKILDRYILKSFVITFATVFVILFFIFILQTVWLFIAELAGKDLDFFLIVKFLMFAMPRIIPLVLPLSVLLASIMTFGSFAENYEFAAMKSSGISLQRAMRPLIAFILLLSVASFFFANNVIPYAEFKFINFRTDIGKKQPAMAIAEGQFSEVGSYNIKVNKKSGENGNFLTGVTIHKKANNGQGTSTVIQSKTGELVSSMDSDILKLVLRDGYYYEDITPKKFEDRKKMPFAKSAFKRYVINMDLSKLNKIDDSGEKVTTNGMLNINELNYTLDSLHKNFDKDVISFADNIYQRTGIGATSRTLQTAVMDTAKPQVKSELPKDLLSPFSKSDKLALLRIASGNVESTNFSIDGSVFEMQDKIKNINNHELAFFDKFVIAYACLLMFFIGAPLGAIIRKGGVGLPIVFAILIFITFHFINTFGKKISQSDGLPPFMGAWMSSFILSPFAVLLTYRAANDMSIAINFDWIVSPLQRWFGKKEKAVMATPDNDIIQLDFIEPEHDADWDDMSQLSDNTLIGIVKNAKQFNYTEDKRIKALKILDSRGISQHDLLRDGNLTNTKFEETKEAYDSYRSLSNIILTTYVLWFVFAVVAKIKPNTVVFILAFVNAIVFYFTLYKGSQELQRISELTNKKIGINLYLVLFLGFPFYILMHFYNRSHLKEALAQNNF